MKSVQIVAGLVLAAVCAGALADAVYRWKDEKGKWHFSDVPPEGVGAEPFEYSNMSIVSMPKPVQGASAAETGLPPECEPSYRGDKPCPLISPSGERPVEGAEKSAEDKTKVDDSAEKEPERERSGEVRKDTLRNRAEQIKDYNKPERVEEIRERTEATKSYERGKPPKVNEKIRERNTRPTPAN